MDKITELMWELKLRLLRIRCFFTGHREVTGVYYEDGYCSRCFISWPEDRVTIPFLLNRLYCWTGEREWKWFDRLDNCLWKHYGQFLPHWWSC